MEGTCEQIEYKKPVKRTKINRTSDEETGKMLYCNRPPVLILDKREEEEEDVMLIYLKELGNSLTREQKCF